MGSTRSLGSTKVWALFCLIFLGGPLVAEAAQEGKPQVVPAYPFEACGAPLPALVPIATLGGDLYLIGHVAPKNKAQPCSDLQLELPGGFLPAPASHIGDAQGLSLYRVSGEDGAIPLLDVIPYAINPDGGDSPGAAQGPWVGADGRLLGIGGPSGWRSGADVLKALDTLNQLKGLRAMASVPQGSPALITGADPAPLWASIGPIDGRRSPSAPWPVESPEDLALAATLANTPLALAATNSALLIASHAQWAPTFGRPEARLLGAKFLGGTFPVARPQVGDLADALIPVYQGIRRALTLAPGSDNRRRILEDTWSDLGDLFQQGLGLTMEGRASLLGLRGGIAVILAEGAPQLLGDDDARAMWLARGRGDLNGALTLVPPQTPLKGQLLGDRAYVVALSPTSGVDELQMALMDIEDALALLPREGKGTEWALLKWTEGQLLGRLAALTPASDGGGLETLARSREAFGWALNRFTPTGTPLAFGALSIDMGQAIVDGAHGDRQRILQGVEAIGAGVEHLDIDGHPLGAAQGLITYIEASILLPFAKDGEIIEGAIGASDIALTLIDPKDAPYPWATLQTLRGYAYQVRLLGNRDFRVDRAIEAYEAALTVFTQKAYPQEWSKAMVNLASAWLQRTLGEPEANNAQARQLLGEVLTQAESLGDPILIATAHNNLGLAWLRRSGGNRLKNLRQSTDSFTRALESLDGEGSTEAAADRAQTEANLDISRYYIAAEELARGNPGTSRATASLGDAYLLEGLEYREWILLTQGEDRFRQAVERYEAAIAIQPDISLNYHKRSVALWKLLEVEEAIAAEVAALDLDPENLLYTSWLTFLEGKALLMADSGSGEGHRKMGQFHLTHWELPEALDAFQRAWNADKSLIDVPGEIARIHVNQGRPEEALEAAKMGLQEAPTHFELNAIAHSISFEILHDFEGALPFAEAMVSLTSDPDASLTLTRLETHLTVGNLRLVKKEGRGLRDEVSGGDRVVLHTLLWLERLAAGGKDKRAAQGLLDAYGALPMGATIPWSMGGLTHWVQGSPWEGTPRAEAVLEVLAAPKSEDGLKALEAALP